MVALVQSAPIGPSGSANSPITFTFPGNTTAGNMVIAFYSIGLDPTVTAVAVASTHDTLTFTISEIDSNDGQWIGISRKFNITGGDKIFTLTQTGSTACTGCAMEVSGLGNGSLRGTAVGPSVVGASISTSSSLGAAGDFIVACGYTGVTRVSVSATGGLTLNSSDLNANDLLGNSYLLSASGAVTPGFSWTTASGGCAIVAAAFIPATDVLMAQACM